MENKETLIKHSLIAFLFRHNIKEICIDEIVLSYVISILEDLGSNEAAEESFDVEEFTEMMSAYLLGFDNIKSVAVCEWMFELSSRLSGPKEKANKLPVLLSSYIPDTSSQLEDCRSVSESSMNNNYHITKIRSASESSADSAISSSSSSKVNSCDVDEEHVQQLLEMFPAACALDVRHYLIVANGDMETAAQMLLIPETDGARDSSQSIPKNPSSLCLKKKGCAVLDDKCVKDQILQKYSYIDLDEDKKTFRPPPHKKEPKKMIRYLDGRIVSTKGERFTEVKKEEDEDQKKTYVNLKPARQYRFH